MLQCMDPDLIRQLLEKEEDVLTPQVKAEAEFFKRVTCPVCRESGCEKRTRAPKITISETGEPVFAVSPFGSNNLPDGYAHCIHCGTDFNPYTGLIYKTEASMIHGSL